MLKTRKNEQKIIQNIGIYRIGYITIKKIDDYENIHNVNPLYFIIDKADGYIEESNGNRYLTLFLQTKTKNY